MKTKTSREEMSNKRKTELVEATLRVIAERGVKAATVRTIAEAANVTQGLIRYHFKSKEELIIAAYEHHMTRLIDVAAQAADGEFSSAKKRLAKFVEASVTAPIIDAQVIAIWAGFFQLLFHNAPMRENHKKTYNLLRIHIRDLVAAVYEEEGRTISATALRQISIALNGVLDGLWIEGGIIPDEFERDELVDTALMAFSRIIAVDLHPYLRDTIE